MPNEFDIAIIGAGAVGAAIARELAQYNLSIALLDAAPDVGMGTSKASTAIWHTGFDAKPGTLEAQLMRRSYALMERLAPELGIPIERTGGLLIAWNAEQLSALPALLDKAHHNGVTDTRLISAAEVYQREPHLGPGALGGMLVPGEHLLCTYSVPLACAYQAVANGVMLKLNYAVQSIVAVEDRYILTPTPSQPFSLPIGAFPDGEGRGGVACRYLINAAGLYSDEINRLLGHTEFTVMPRRGELIIFDKLARPLVNHILLPVPTAKTKGVLISPTIYGNLLLGPTAEDLPDKTATNTTAEGLQSLLAKGRAIVPELMNEEVTATYAGLRAATEHSDYQIYAHPAQCYICVGGIRSTGISAALGIAEYVVEALKDMGLPLTPKADFRTIRLPNIGEANPRPYQQAERIAANPAYGQIICHCERVTLGEIMDATRAPIPARTLDGLRRRTRAMQGRCQGFNCHAALTSLLQKSAEV